MSKMLKTKKLVLALGESTNTHILKCKKDVEYTQENQNIGFLLKDTGIITHEEHALHVITPGEYSKTNQVEFNPFDQSVNQVFD